MVSCIERLVPLLDVPKMNRPYQDADRLGFGAGRAALWALRTSAVDDGEVWRRVCVISPNERHLRIEEAAARLDELPKPVTCMSFMSLGRLVLSCWPRSNDLEWVQRFRRDAEGEVKWLRQYYRPAETSLFRLVAEDSCLISLDVFERLLFDYHFPFANRVVTSAPHEGATGCEVATIKFAAPVSGGTMLSGMPKGR